jgi:hypothetical protein
LRSHPRAVVQIQERNVTQDKALLIHFKKDLEKCSMIKQDHERLHLLLTITEGEEFQHKVIVKNMYGNFITISTNFIASYG